MDRKIFIDPKIAEFSRSEKIKMIHTNFDIEDPIKAEMYIKDMSFQLLVFTDLDYKYLKCSPKGKVIEILLGEIVLWLYEFHHYILVDTIKNEKKDNFLIISGDLYNFDESLK